MRSTGVHHIDLVVSDLARSLAFYGAILRPLGWHDVSQTTGERGETIHYHYGPGSSIGNLTLAYTPYWNPTRIRDRRIRTDGNHALRLTNVELDGWYYDVNADYEFALGPGRLKLIGLRHWDKEPVVTTQPPTEQRVVPAKNFTMAIWVKPDTDLRVMPKESTNQSLGPAMYSVMKAMSSSDSTAKCCG